MRGNDFMELRAFELVARHQSFSRAADHLGVSRAAVSSVVKNLEKRLGVQLLTRTTRSVSLTDPGRELLDRLSPALNELVSAVVHIDQFREQPRGRIRLVTCQLGAELHLGTLIPSFVDAQPEVTFDVHIDESEVEMTAAGFDAAIRAEGYIDQDLVALKLGPSCDQVLIASPSYIRRTGHLRSLDELNRHACIKVASPAVGNGDWALIGRGGARRVVVKDTICVNNYTFAMQLVLADLGIALVPRVFAGAALDNGAVEQLLPDFSGTVPQFFLCYPPHHCSTLAFRSLVDFVRDNRPALESSP